MTWLKCYCEREREYTVINVALSGPALWLCVHWLSGENMCGVELVCLCVCVCVVVCICVSECVVGCLVIKADQKR